MEDKVYLLNMSVIENAKDSEIFKIIYLYEADKHSKIKSRKTLVV